MLESVVEDTPSENGQTGAIEAISSLSLTPNTERSIRRAGGERARRRLVYSDHKEKIAGRPPIRRGKQSKDNQQGCQPKHLQFC